MRSQKEHFLKSEGDNYYLRNKTKANKEQIKKNDSLMVFLKTIGFSPKNVLDIGCGNGELLNRIKNEHKAMYWGIDPSSMAIKDAKTRFPKISFQVATADYLPFKDGQFDVIFFGFCLYICDRNDLFKIAYEADRCLLNGGMIIINDFFPDFPYKNYYKFNKDVFSYKMDYSKMFKWNPFYNEIASIRVNSNSSDLRDVLDNKEGFVALKKNDLNAYILEPYKHSKIKI